MEGLPSTERNIYARLLGLKKGKTSQPPFYVAHPLRMSRWCKAYNSLMLSIPGRTGRTCDGFSRRELLRVGGASLIGLSLPDFLAWKASAAEAKTEQKGKPFGAAKSVIMLFLQGGPSHIDIWDPKPDAPSNIRGEFKPIKTKVPGIQFAETMPMLADQMDKFTIIRSMSYTPSGLFNHTAAIYQMMTGWAPDKVSPSGQLEPPSPRDFPHMGCQISRLQPLSS